MIELLLSSRFWLVVSCAVVQLCGWSDFLALQRGDFADDHWKLLHLFTFAFAHGNWIHLGVNTWVLLNFGPLVERFMGRLGFLALFFSASVFGGLLEYLMDPRVNILVGASAGVCGIVAVCLLQEPAAQVLVLLLELPAIWVLILFCWGSFLLVEITWIRTDVAHWAHMGGLIVGIILYLSLTLTRLAFLGVKFEQFGLKNISYANRWKR